MTYLRLLEVTAAETNILAENQTPPSFDEIEVQSRWFSGYFSRNHQSNHSQTISIISPGEWNRGAGPDFINATIEVDGESRHGPIELDLDSRNWERHGHNQSKHFDDVILHIVINDSGPTFFTRTSNHRDIPRIIISPAEVNAALSRPRLSQALARPGRCLQPLAQMTAADVTSLLRESAKHRAQLKAARFQGTAQLHGFSQALWEALADSLGFSANRLPMRLLAQRLPIKKLLKHRPEDLEAIIFGTAEFLSPNLHKTAPYDSREWLEDLWTRWWKHRHDYEYPITRTPAWSTRATRPGNHPQRRLAALATAALQWPVVTKFAKETPPFENFLKCLSNLNEPFWNHHHTLLSARTEKPIKLIGKSRLEEFLINTLYPLHPEHWAEFQKVRAAAPNQKVKRSCERLFGSLANAKPHLKFAWQQQALLQVYQDFCLEDLSNCTECSFPKQLAQWKSTDD
jgi:hypothetical protein